MEITERQISRHFYQTQMRGLLHLALLKPVIMVTIMGKMFFPQNQPAPRPTAPPPNLPQNSTAQPTAMDDALICYYHQRPLRICFKLLSQRKVATLASGEPNEMRHDCVGITFPKLSPSRLLYVADKLNRCNYLIDTSAAVSVLPRSCANRTADSDSLVAANNSITTHSTSKRLFVVIYCAEIKQPILGADFLIHYNLLVDLTGRCLRDMRTGLAIQATLSSIKPLSLVTSTPNRLTSSRS